MTTHADYAAIPGVNWSRLKAMADSPLAYQYGLTHPREDSPALLLGRAIHCAILEPDSFAARYTVRPEGIDGRTKAGKAALAELEASGREVLTADQGAIAVECAAAVRAHPVASLVFDGVQTEQTIAWTIDGRACKGRIDALNRLWLGDLKTTHDLGKFLRRDFWQYLTHGQFAWYRDGAVAAGALDPDADAYVVAVRTTRPVDVAVREIDEDTIAAGRRLYRRLLARLAECEALGEWPGAYPQLEALDCPRWADGAEMTDATDW